MKFLTPLMFLALAAAIAYWFMYPTYQEVAVLGKDKAEYQAAIERATKAGERRDELVIKHNTLTDSDVELLKLEKMLPDTSDNIKLVVDINGIATKYGSTIENISYAETKAAASVSNGDQSSVPTTAYKPITLTFKTKMTYTNFLRFLTDVQQNLRLSDVSAVEFTSDSTGLYDFTITLKTYVMR